MCERRLAQQHGARLAVEGLAKGETLQGKRIVIVEDVIKLLDSVSESLRRGHYPDKGHGNKVAQVLRAVAADLEL